MTVPWTEVRYDGDSRDHAATRRRKLLDWRAGSIRLSVRDGLTPDRVDWTGCERPPGRPAVAGSRAGSPILVRVSDDERAALTRAAEAAGEPLSTWLRETGLRGAKEETMATRRCSADDLEVLEAVAPYLAACRDGDEDDRSEAREEMLGALITRLGTPSSLLPTRP